MNASHSRLNLRRLLFSAAIITISAGLGLGALPASAQDAPPPPPRPAQQQAPPPQQYTPPQEQMGQQQAAPLQDQIPIPPSLTLPAGTLIQIRINDRLSSDHNQPGDRFSASLEQPLIANGWVVARRGQLLTGRVVAVKKAGRVSGTSQLGVEIVELTFVDGQILPVRTSLMQSTGGTSNGRDATAIVGTTGLGAIIGGAAEGGGGAAVGAGIGAAAGILGVLATRGRPTVLYPETLLTFRLETPLAISTERGQIAFQPAGQSDYAQDQDAYGRQRQLVRRPAYGPGYGPYGPNYYGYGGYPYYWGSPYWGGYPFVGFGFGFRGGGHFRGGRRH
jgi:hypothetical protein